jgi:metal-dependent amidase/aminoacylase/carboxypeptidase family protein
MMELDLREELAGFLAAREAELIAFRRDLHAHPETGYREYRTTSRVLLRLTAAGLHPVTPPKGTIYVWAPVPEGYPSAGEYCEHVRDETGVVVSPGVAFGESNEIVVVDMSGAVILEQRAVGNVSDLEGGDFRAIHRVGSDHQPARRLLIDSRRSTGHRRDIGNGSNRNGRRRQPAA